LGIEKRAKTKGRPAEGLLNGFVRPSVCLSFCNYAINTEEIFEKSDAEQLKKTAQPFQISIRPGEF
jgi:hypothetical protein